MNNKACNILNDDQALYTVQYIENMSASQYM